MAQKLRSVWLEITGRCQLECGHCYAGSGPTGTHGTMTADDWRRVIDQAAEAGIGMVQFIGGEPTLHPALPSLIEHALDRNLPVEVYSNLVHVRPVLWSLFARPGVQLATSYYSDDADEHAAITGRRPTHARTRANIAEAVRRGIPVRVGIIDVLDEQRVAQARAELDALGVTSIGTDRLRGIGRGGDGVPDVGELCGHCGDGRAAVLPDGGVSPCVMSRWMSAGNVRDHSLVDILEGSTMRELVSAVPAPVGVCNPQCKPSLGDGSDCAPAETPACKPKH